MEHVTDSYSFLLAAKSNCTREEVTMKWLLQFGELSTLFEPQSFKGACDYVIGTFSTLVPSLKTSKFAFEGCCFPGAPQVAVLSEDSFGAFNAAAAQYVAGPPSMKVVVTDQWDWTIPSRSSVTAAASTTPSAKKAVSTTQPSSQQSTQQQSSTANRVMQRLNNIKKTYEDLSAPGATQLRVESPKKNGSSSTTALKRSAPAHAPTEADSGACGDSGPYLTAAEERRRLQRALEDEEKLLAASLWEREKKATKPTQLSDDSYTTSTSTSSVVTLMVWGSEVHRGVPLQVNMSSPPALSTMMRQVGALLDQPVKRLSYKTELDQVDVDIEENDDVAVLVDTVRKVGAGYVVLTAWASSGDTDQPVTYTKMRREMKASGRTNGASNSSSLTPMTSPIKMVNAPSPPPVVSGVKERPRPPPSLVNQLD